MYLVVDLMSDYKNLRTYKELKDFLIELVMQDLRENLQEPTLKEDMMNNLNIIEKLSKEKATSLNYIKEHLESFSYKIIDLEELHRALYDLAEYIDTDTGINKTLEKIESLISEGYKNGR